MVLAMEDRILANSWDIFEQELFQVSSKKIFAKFSKALATGPLAAKRKWK